MSQRRSYPNSGDFNLDDLFRPEPAAPQQQQQPPQQPPHQQAGPQPPHGGPGYQGQGEYQGGPEYLAPGAPWGEQPTGYAAEPAPVAAGETQYLPPYPTSEPVATFGGQQSFTDPAQYPHTPGYQGGPAYPPPNEQTTRLGRASLPEPEPAGRFSRKAVVGGVVAACVVGGILVGVLASGSGDDAKAKPKAKHTAAASTGASPSASAGASAGGSALSPDAQAQAQALSTLLGTANASRQAVIGAVGAVKKCDNPGAAQTALTQASTQRKQLVTSLAALKVDKLPTGAQLVTQLNQAWQASANADDSYAAWAGDFSQSCDPTKVGQDPNLQAGDQASGTATTAKGQASTLWNAIAQQAGLPSLGPSQL
ncbi:hypothetical protein OG455_17430 [Kitasatospora sp. NBC_01287]|uniref:hypothetical protein n=1 Tax=Kitasatospora sp. NBC_01287 TaxID=2903573 RepID=UPI00224DAB80|nr:hypothetical protein [Kitasatospora sp. NBC_01287]MCX4747281.1 hypothetical protein [Kitasatospora sp. NBC_01287]